MKTNQLTEFYQVHCVGEFNMLHEDETTEKETFITLRLPHDSLLYVGRVVLRLRLDAIAMVKDFSHLDHDHSRRFHLFGGFVSGREQLHRARIPSITSSVVPVEAPAVVFDITDFIKSWRKPRVSSSRPEDQRPRPKVSIVFSIRRSCDRCKNEPYDEPDHCMITKNAFQHYVGFSYNVLFGHNAGNLRFRNFPNVTEWAPLHV